MTYIYIYIYLFIETQTSECHGKREKYCVRATLFLPITSVGFSRRTRKKLEIVSVGLFLADERADVKNISFYSRKNNYSSVNLTHSYNFQSDKYLRLSH